MTIKEILVNIYGITDEQGLSENDIKYFENRFGKIPDTLKEFYLVCGNNLRVTIGQDYWLLPEHYKKWEWLEESKDFLILNENQGVCQALIKECDLGQANPPVYVTFDEPATPDENRTLNFLSKMTFSPVSEFFAYREVTKEKQPKICANSVDEFVKAFLVYEGSLCMPHLQDNFYFINEDEFEFIKSNFKEYPFKIENWLGNGSIRFFHDNPDSIICVIGNFQMHYGARSRKSFEQLEKLLGGMGEPG